MEIPEMCHTEQAAALWPFVFCLVMMAVFPVYFNRQDTCKREN